MPSFTKQSLMWRSNKDYCILPRQLTFQLVRLSSLEKSTFGVKSKLLPDIRITHHLLKLSHSHGSVEFFGP